MNRKRYFIHKKLKLRKVTAFLVLISMCNITLLSCSRKEDSAKDTNAYQGTINVWSWNNELITSGIIKKFEQEYPGVYVNLVTIPNDNNAYTTKLIATLRSSVCAPDVYLAESATVRKLSNMDYFENLSNAPYNAEELTSNMVPYTVALGRNDVDNSIRTLTWQATPGGFFYRRSLAKKYLGTDDPAELQKKMSTMDDFIQMGETIKTESNGSVSLLANYSELQYVALANRSKGWVENGALTIDPSMMDYIDIAKKIRDNGYDANAKQWTPNWTKAMADGSVFGFVLPTWGLSSLLQVNAPNTSGDWGFVEMPTSYYWGGSWIGMYKNSHTKDLSWLFIKYITSNEEFLRSYAADTGDFVNNTNVQQQISTSEEGNNAFVGNQNIYSSYSKLVENINGDTITEYDESINAAWGTSIERYMNGKIKKEEIIPEFKKAVKKAYPAISVD